MSKQVATSPVGELEYVIITGEGREDLSGNPKYSSTVVLEGKAKEAFEKEIMDFWEANRPRHIKEPKSTGMRPHTAPTGETDEDGDKIYEETGKTAFRFSTGTTWPDGNTKKIKVFNAKGAEVDLGNKRIGNGSVGRLQGSMDIYEVKPKGGKKATEAGVTLYLDGVQIQKFVEYVGGPSFDALDTEEGWEGPNEMGGLPDESEKSDEADAPTGKPRL